ncbi:unnamed protein product [Ectocarpus sp. CCAP 1310/34]|nr:unnamed protein product [Ectocarpus sp. CCAP 1310/34]
MLRAFMEETGITENFPGLAVLSITPLVLCQRAGCLLNLYDKRMRVLSKERIARKLKLVPAARTKWTGSPEPVRQLQRRLLDRCCTSDAAVEVLLRAVDISGRVLDMCGGPCDAVARLLGATCELITNDISGRLSPGSKKAPDMHLDASATTFCAAFLENSIQQRPDWVVKSPP